MEGGRSRTVNGVEGVECTRNRERKRGKGVVERKRGGRAYRAERGVGGGTERKEEEGDGRG